MGSAASLSYPMTMGMHEFAESAVGSRLGNTEHGAWSRSKLIGYITFVPLMMMFGILLLDFIGVGDRILFGWLRLFMLITLVVLVYLRTRLLLLVRNQLVTEREQLENMLVTHRQDSVSLATRIEQDRMDRIDRVWIDTEVRSILWKIQGTVIPDDISDLLIEGLGRTLKADFVIFDSFGKFQKGETWRQWSQTSATEIDFSRIAKYQSSLSDFTKRLDEGLHAVVVSDSHLIDVSRGSYPEIVAISKEVARSWVLVPVGEAMHELGHVWIGMVADVRDWSKAEVEFVQKITSDAAEILTHARMFRQSMQIAENDAEVSRLVELGKVRNDFIDNINHELRTPLTSIVGYVEVALGYVDSIAEPELASSLTVVQRNALRLQILIENMMQVSKGDFEHVPLTVATLDFGHLLGDIVNSLHLSAEAREVTVTLRLDSPEGDLILDGDSSRLEQVFVNLLSNAIKFTPRGGTVTIVARRSQSGGDVVEVKVKDTGIGIPAREFPNVFKRFFRASTATQASIPGFGIGLSLVQSIVREHRGTITFDSTVGKGTEFTVTLPAQHTPASQVVKTK